MKQSNLKSASFVITSMRAFGKRLLRLPKVLTRGEKWAISVLLLVIVGAVLAQTSQGGVNPAYGGTYTEGFIGQPRFVNPVLAATDIDLSLTKMLYTGLTKLSPEGDIQPDLANSWDISDDGKTYTFHLKNDLMWHDGQKVTAADVVYTINLMKDPGLKSPHYEEWQSVTAEAPDDQTVVFRLKDVTGNFLHLASIGIVPQHIGQSGLNSSFIGTGPYKYRKIRTTKAQKLESFVLVRNTKWYGPHLPYVDAIEAWFYANQNDAETALQKQKIMALVASSDQKYTQKYSIELPQQVTLFLNTQVPGLATPAARTALLDDSTNLTLSLKVVIESTHAQDPAVLTAMDRWKQRGITASITETAAADIKTTVLSQSAYDVLIVSVDHGADVDQYAYWHSSQANGGLNFSRLKNPDLDKLVTDGRKITDLQARQDNMMRVEALVDTQFVRKVLNQDAASYNINKNVHIVPMKRGYGASDRLSSISDWYIKTKR